VANEENGSEAAEAAKFLEQALKAFQTIRKNLDAKHFEPPARAAIGAFLLADAVLETESEDTHPRETFMESVDLLSTAFAILESEEADEDESGPEATAS
jgi:hypothetical protein